MSPGLQHVAHLLFGMAAVFALPALAYLIPIAVRGVTKTTASPRATFFGVRNPDAILIMLAGFVRGIEGVGDVAGGLWKLLRQLLLALSLAALVLAALLVITARGVQAGQMWARIVAGIVLGSVFVMATAAALSGGGKRVLRRLLAVIAMVSMFTALRALWNG